jgi:hypothetical protein
MKTVELRDHELSVTDLSNFEWSLQGWESGKCTASFHNWTSPRGTTYVRLTSSVVEFDEAQCPEADIEEVLRAYGFQRKAPA